MKEIILMSNIKFVKEVLFFQFFKKKFKLIFFRINLSKIFFLDFQLLFFLESIY